MRSTKIIKFPNVNNIEREDLKMKQLFEKRVENLKKEKRKKIYLAIFILSPAFYFFYLIIFV
ncbi:hypothetical protein [Psychrobacillus sp. FSL H8-0510]|uniref:hypothetical protein n=1 Tax=Psychrobacillus sp. FSL H8-0510 TaxID=2921394 RepID=UPI0030FC7FBC